MEQITVVWIHVTAAAVWVGGLFYTSHLVLPGLARGERTYAPLLRRARLIGWAALGLLVITGLDNLRRFGLASGWLLAKLLLVLMILALEAHRDFGLLPRALRALEREGDPNAEVRSLRGLDHVLLLLALTVLFLAVGVARGR